MRALSIHPEWAFAITHLGKRIENRSWRPPITGDNGYIAIHASRHFGGGAGAKRAQSQLEALRRMAKRAGWTDQGFDAVLAAAEANTPPDPRTAIPGIPVGAIVATARLINCRHPLDDKEPWAIGPWCWILDDVRRLVEPIVCKGRQGLWNAGAHADAIEAARTRPAGGSPR